MFKKKLQPYLLVYTGHIFLTFSRVSHSHNVINLITCFQHQLYLCTCDNHSYSHNVIIIVTYINTDKDVITLTNICQSQKKLDEFKQNIEQYQQNLIKPNYSTLVKEMKAIPVAGYLMKNHIITDEMQQHIQFEKTMYSRNRKLLSLILKRGPKAFHGLNRAPLKAVQNDFAKLLEPY